MQTLKEQLQQVKKTGWSLFLYNSLDFFFVFPLCKAVYGADGEKGRSGMSLYTHC